MMADQTKKLSLKKAFVFLTSSTNYIHIVQKIIIIMNEKNKQKLPVYSFKWNIREGLLLKVHAQTQNAGNFWIILISKRR